MKRLDHRIKLMGGIALICLIIISMLGVTLYIASERMELALVEQLVTEELEFLIQRYNEDSGYQPAKRPNFEYYILDDQNQISSLPPETRRLNEGHHEVYLQSAGGQRDVFIRDVGHTRFQIIYDIGPYETKEAGFQRLVIFSVIFAIGMAVLLGFLLSGYLTRQLTLLTQQVSNLKPGQPYAPLVNDQQDKEVAILAKSFENYHKHFLSMIKREQDFTANVAHELRTPLTTIRTSCELLANIEGLDKKSSDRIQYIIQSVDSMDEHAEALLFLARGGKFNADKNLYLKEIVQDALSTFRVALASKNLDCKIDISTDQEIVANQQALQLVLNNLLKNAIMYTENGGIYITYTNNTLSVKDTGCGIPGDQLSKIFERQYRADNNKPGLGLGLDIVNRVCIHSGWQITVKSNLGKGTTFNIHFSENAKTENDQRST